jgi:hypothetical protein
MPSLIRPLFDGPLDLIGDVHGEIEALKSLVARLGYDEHGRHPQGRRLVFLGDLTDRGPDSPAVVDYVAKLVDAGRAQCVLGNHDLNILLDHEKPENGWFWGKEFIDKCGDVIPQKLADDAVRERVLKLFSSLPFALERDDLRVVHASWNPAAIELARRAQNVRKLYDEHRNRIESELSGVELDNTGRALRHQNDNPVKLLTSGPEERSDVPIESGGKIRYEKRVPWWSDYSDVFCVYGHYSIADGNSRGGNAAFCIDYGVGKRWMERREGKSKDYSFKLAALRFPEREVLFDPLSAETSR